MEKREGKEISPDYDGVGAKNEMGGRLPKRGKEGQLMEKIVMGNKG